MPLEIIKDRKIEVPPTSLCLTEENIIISLKKKVMFITNYTCEKIRRFPIKENIRFIASNDTNTFCFSEKKNFFIVDEDLKNIIEENNHLKTFVNVACNDQINKKIIAGTNDGKIFYLNYDGAVEKYFFDSTTPVLDLDVNIHNKVISVNSLDQKVRIYGSSSAKSKSILIPKGQPLCVCYVGTSYAAVGTSLGTLYLLNIQNNTIISELTTTSKIISLASSNDKIYLGTYSGEIYAVSYLKDELTVDEIVKFQGMVNCLKIKKNFLVALTSKEPKIGRLYTNPKGSNRLILIKIQ